MSPERKKALLSLRADLTHAMRQIAAIVNEEQCASDVEMIIVLGHLCNARAAIERITMPEPEERHV